MILETSKILSPIPSFPEDAECENVVFPYRNKYECLYFEIGKNWDWTSKNNYTNEQWNDLLPKHDSQILILKIAGKDAGLIHLDFKNKPDVVELEIFGLVKSQIGKGLGKPWLGVAMMIGLHGINKCKKIKVSTCSSDHPRALTTYKEMGFKTVKKILI